MPPMFDMGTLTKKGIRLHEGTWITRQAYLSLTQPSSSSHHESTAQPDSSSLSESVQLLQRSVDTLLRHVRYLEHGVTMALSEPLRGEFRSDKIFFGISSDAEDGSEHAESASADDDSGRSSSAASGSSPSASDPSVSSRSTGDEAFVHHFKKSKTLP